MPSPWQKFGSAAYIPKPDMEKLFNSFESPRERALFGVCRWTACRLHESLKLKVSDIKADRIIFPSPITKEKATRSVAINPKLRELLDVWLRVRPSKNDWLFPGRGGNHLATQTASKLFKDAVVRAGLDGETVSTHSLRRSAITDLNRAGVDLATIMSISGHASLKNVQKYITVSPDDHANAVNLL